MAVFKFNKTYRDKELKREVLANEPVEMTIKRADEVVKNVKSQSGVFADYEDFGYERIDNKPEDPPVDTSEEKQEDSQKDSADASAADEKQGKQGKGE